MQWIIPILDNVYNYIVQGLWVLNVILVILMSFSKDRLKERKYLILLVINLGIISGITSIIVVLILVYINLQGIVLLPTNSTTFTLLIKSFALLTVSSTITLACSELLTIEEYNDKLKFLFNLLEKYRNEKKVD